MISALRDFTDRLLGRGDAAITVPPFDGALKPNQLLETAEVAAEFAEAEDLASDGEMLYVANRSTVLQYDGVDSREIRRFDQPITALCLLPGGKLAVALAGREIRVFESAAGIDEGLSYTSGDMNAVNALAAGQAGTLLATDGSTVEAPARWAHDLMNRGRSGRLLSIDLATRQIRVVTNGLEYAFGVASSGDGAIVSESWRHRLVKVAANGEIRQLLDNLPVYPSRIALAADGGFWLTGFTGRTQLVEFVLRENAFRRRMMQEIDPQFWIVPRLSSGKSFREPMQGAHLKTMGVIKPWAPPRSYGFIVRLSADGVPLYSLHSRVDGHNHGVVAALEVGDWLYVLAKGPGRLLRLPLRKLEQEYGA